MAESTPPRPSSSSPISSPSTLPSQPGRSFTPSPLNAGSYNDSSFRMTGEFIANDSPTSTFSETNSTGIRLDPSRSTFRNVLASGTPSRQTRVRSDPSLLTCFDPADEELYDLWATKK